MGKRKKAKPPPKWKGRTGYAAVAGLLFLGGSEGSASLAGHHDAREPAPEEAPPRAPDSTSSIGEPLSLRAPSAGAASAAKMGRPAPVTDAPVAPSSVTSDLKAAVGEAYQRATEATSQVSDTSSPATGGVARAAPKPSAQEPSGQDEPDAGGPAPEPSGTAPEPSKPAPDRDGTQDKAPAPTPDGGGGGTVDSTVGTLNDTVQGTTGAVGSLLG
ncbi:MAG: hypothetical protein ACRDPT_01940 [Streptomycetales bacterium]